MKQSRGTGLRWCLLLLLVWNAVGAAQTRPRQVLLLYSYERDFAPHIAFTELFRPELSRRSPHPVEFTEVSLQAARASRTAPDESLIPRIQSVAAARQPDLIVAIGGPAAVFAQRYRQQLFPDAAMLLAGVDQRFVHSRTVTDNDSVVAVDHEPARLVENILSVLPDTRTIFVVVGASHLEQVWLDEMKRVFRPFEHRVTFSWANELSFAEMVKRCSGLPANSAILFALLSLDATGQPQVESQALSELHARANAPIFGPRSTQLGRGIVGGPLVSVDDLSQNTASFALRLLDGEPPRNLRSPVQRLGAPVFDARELRRWDIDEQRLPPGSVIRFREPTVWPQYQHSLVAFAGLAVLSLAVVAGLTARLASQRRTERSLHESERRFRILSNAAPVMLWSAGPDKLRGDFNRCWLDFTGRSINAELADGWTEAVHADDRARWLATYHDAFDRREPFRLECRLRRDDGEYRWILETGVPRFLADGSFAGYAGSAIDVTDLRLARVALSSLNQRLMQTHEIERHSVGRELQDELCQQMIALTLRLQNLSHAPVSDDDEEFRRGVDALSNEFAELAARIFTISDQLCSSKLELLGLAMATRSYCKEMSAQHGVPIEFHEEAMPRHISSDSAQPLFAVIQEALDNALRHSAARRVTVSLRGSGGKIRCDVVDEGLGFDPEQVMKVRGLGLIAMKERLSLLGGECSIESRPGEGTRVRARVPL